MSAAGSSAPVVGPDAGDVAPDERVSVDMVEGAGVQREPVGTDPAPGGVKRQEESQTQINGDANGNGHAGDEAEKNGVANGNGHAVDASDKNSVANGNGSNGAPASAV